MNDKTCKVIRCLIESNKLSAYKISKLAKISYERTLFWLQKLISATVITEHKVSNKTLYSLNDSNSITQNLVRTFELDRIQFTNDFIFVINELNKSAAKKHFEFLIGEPIDINYWANFSYTNYPLEVYINDKTKFPLYYDCINLIERKDEGFYKNGKIIAYFGISFKILNLEYSIVSNLHKISNPRLSIGILAALDRPINWDLLYHLVKKERLEKKLGYFLELKELLNKETNSTNLPKIPRPLLDRIKLRKRNKIKFHSKFFLINNRLETGDPYCILGRQWGIPTPLTKNEILNSF